MKKKRDISINYLIEVKPSEYEKEYHFVKEIVCENEGETTTELLTRECFPLMKCDSKYYEDHEFIVFRGSDKSSFKKTLSKSDDPTIDAFRTFFYSALKKLEKEEDIKTVERIYKMIERRDNYINKHNSNYTKTYKD